MPQNGAAAPFITRQLTRPPPHFWCCAVPASAPLVNWRGSPAFPPGVVAPSSSIWPVGRITTGSPKRPLAHPSSMLPAPKREPAHSGRSILLVFSTDSLTSLPRPQIPRHSPTTLRGESTCQPGNLACGSPIKSSCFSLRAPVLRPKVVAVEIKGIYLHRAWLDNSCGCTAP